MPNFKLKHGFHWQTLLLQRGKGEIYPELNHPEPEAIGLCAGSMSPWHGTVCLKEPSVSQRRELLFSRFAWLKVGGHSPVCLIGGATARLLCDLKTAFEAAQPAQV